MNPQEVTNEVFRNYANNFVDPWINALRSWATETEKYQQTTIDGLTRAVDNGHHLAKESITLAANVATTLQRQVTAQVERAADLFHSLTP